MESRGHESPPRTPRWVKALGVIVVVLVAAFVIIHLTGGGFSPKHN